uniref:Sushi domain-containing protein n=1 Tax=Heterorhabditis bacteriophora TaxID=37862 RepID=A0A1I7WG75_HETBA
MNSGVKMVRYKYLPPHDQKNSQKLSCIGGPQQWFDSTNNQIGKKAIVPAGTMPEQCQLTIKCNKNSGELSAGNTHRNDELEYYDVGETIATECKDNYLRPGITDHSSGIDEFTCTESGWKNINSDGNSGGNNNPGLCKPACEVPDENLSGTTIEISGPLITRKKNNYVQEGATARVTCHKISGRLTLLLDYKAPDGKSVPQQLICVGGSNGWKDIVSGKNNEAILCCVRDGAAGCPVVNAQTNPNTNVVQSGFCSVVDNIVPENCYIPDSSTPVEDIQKLTCKAGHDGYQNDVTGETNVTPLKCVPGCPVVRKMRGAKYTKAPHNSDIVKYGDNEYLRQGVEVIVVCKYDEGYAFNNPEDASRGQGASTVYRCNGASEKYMKLETGSYGKLPGDACGGVCNALDLKMKEGVIIKWKFKSRELHNYTSFLKSIFVFRLKLSPNIQWIRRHLLRMVFVRSSTWNIILVVKKDMSIRKDRVKHKMAIKSSNVRGERMDIKISSRIKQMPKLVYIFLIKRNIFPQSCPVLSVHAAGLRLLNSPQEITTSWGKIVTGGTKYTFTCITGYHYPDGPHSKNKIQELYCHESTGNYIDLGANNSTTTEPAACVKDVGPGCPDPVLLDGKLVMKNCPNGYTAGCQVDIQCNEGYIPVNPDFHSSGIQQLTCPDGNDWVDEKGNKIKEVIKCEAACRYDSTMASYNNCFINPLYVHQKFSNTEIKIMFSITTVILLNACIVSLSIIKIKIKIMIIFTFPLKYSYPAGTPPSITGIETMKCDGSTRKYVNSTDGSEFKKPTQCQRSSGLNECQKLIQDGSKTIISEIDCILDGDYYETPCKINVKCKNGKSKSFELQNQFYEIEFLVTHNVTGLKMFFKCYAMLCFREGRQTLKCNGDTNQYDDVDSGIRNATVLPCEEAKGCQALSPTENSKKPEQISTCYQNGEYYNDECILLYGCQEGSYPVDKEYLYDGGQKLTCIEQHQAWMDKKNKTQTSVLECRKGCAKVDYTEIRDILKENGNTINYDRYTDTEGGSHTCYSRLSYIKITEVINRVMMNKNPYFCKDSDSTTNTNVILNMKNACENSCVALNTTSLPSGVVVKSQPPAFKPYDEDEYVGEGRIFVFECSDGFEYPPGSSHAQQRQQRLMCLNDGNYSDTTTGQNTKNILPCQKAIGCSPLSPSSGVNREVENCVKMGPVFRAGCQVTFTCYDGHYPVKKSHRDKSAQVLECRIDLLTGPEWVDVISRQITEQLTCIAGCLDPKELIKETENEILIEKLNYQGTEVICKTVNISTSLENVPPEIRRYYCGRGDGTTVSNSTEIPCTNVCEMLSTDDSLIVKPEYAFSQLPKGKYIPNGVKVKVSCAMAGYIFSETNSPSREFRCDASSGIYIEIGTGYAGFKKIKDTCEKKITTCNGNAYEDEHTMATSSCVKDSKGTIPEGCQINVDCITDIIADVCRIKTNQRTQCGPYILPENVILKGSTCDISKASIDCYIELTCATAFTWPNSDSNQNSIRKYQCTEHGWQDVITYEVFKNLHDTCVMSCPVVQSSQNVKVLIQCGGDTNGCRLITTCRDGRGYVQVTDQTTELAIFDCNGSKGTWVERKTGTELDPHKRSDLNCYPAGGVITPAPPTNCETTRFSDRLIVKSQCLSGVCQHIIKCKPEYVWNDETRRRNPKTTHIYLCLGNGRYKDISNNQILHQISDDCQIPPYDCLTPDLDSNVNHNVSCTLAQCKISVWCDIGQIWQNMDKKSLDRVHTYTCQNKKWRDQETWISYDRIPDRCTPEDCDLGELSNDTYIAVDCSSVGDATLDGCTLTVHCGIGYLKTTEKVVVETIEEFKCDKESRKWRDTKTNVLVTAKEALDKCHSDNRQSNITLIIIIADFNNNIEICSSIIHCSFLINMLQKTLNNSSETGELNEICSFLLNKFSINCLILFLIILDCDSLEAQEGIVTIYKCYVGKNGKYPKSCKMNVSCKEGYKGIPMTYTCVNGDWFNNGNRISNKHCEKTVDTDGCLVNDNYPKELVINQTCIRTTSKYYKTDCTILLQCPVGQQWENGGDEPEQWFCEHSGRWISSRGKSGLYMSVEPCINKSTTKKCREFSSETGISVNYYCEVENGEVENLCHAKVSCRDGQNYLF